MPARIRPPRKRTLAAAVASAGLTAATTAPALSHLTRDGWDPAEPLTRAALDPRPFLQINDGGKRPPSSVSQQGALPDEHGRHPILAGWDVADTGNAFSQCSDAGFG